MLIRNKHYQEVLIFLKENISDLDWKLSYPPAGRGHETYTTVGEGSSYFIKLGVDLPRYLVMTDLDLTPPIIHSGFLTDGTSIVVQPFIHGRTPTWKDFRQNLDLFAEVVKKMQKSRELQMALPKVISEQYRQVGLTAFNRLEKKWFVYRSFVPSAADEIENVLFVLKHEIKKFKGEGLVASHHDICNANWLMTPTGKIYLVDLEAMTRDDPAHDLGSLLWWYYPPELRGEFLSLVGYPYDTDFNHRMQVRMTMHSLDILLPRPNSYDRFDVTVFLKHLEGFRAVSRGEQNPHGYEDIRN